MSGKSDRKEKDKRQINKIIENYKKIEKSIVEQLYMDTNHPSTLGGYREEIWKSLFEQIVPKKFSIERSVFILDSEGNVSDEVDLVIFDEQYTPYIFKYGIIKFIPIEAVAVVIQCKSKGKNNDKEDLEKWLESINKLQTSDRSIARMAMKIVDNEYEENKKMQTQTQTTPIKILCDLYDKKSEMTEGFDIEIQAVEKDEKLVLLAKDITLGQWYKDLNHSKESIESQKYCKWNNRDEKCNQECSQECNIDCNGKRNLSEYTVKSGFKEKEVMEISILSLIFKLNQLLMLINNPLLFPHKAYVDMFNSNNEQINQEKR